VPDITLGGDKVLIESWRKEYNSPHSMLWVICHHLPIGEGLFLGNDNAGGV